MAEILGVLGKVLGPILAPIGRRDLRRRRVVAKLPFVKAILEAIEHWMGRIMRGIEEPGLFGERAAQKAVQTSERAVADVVAQGEKTALKEAEEFAPTAARRGEQEAGETGARDVALKAEQLRRGGDLAAAVRRGQRQDQHAGAGARRRPLRDQGGALPVDQEVRRHTAGDGHFRIEFTASPGNTLDADYTAGVPPFEKLDPEELEKLRERARDSREAADELLRQYDNMSDVELLERFANGDATAEALVRRKFGSNEAALKKVLGKDYRPPHSAKVRLERGGAQTNLGDIHSEGIERMTPEERALDSAKHTGDAYGSTSGQAVPAPEGGQDGDRRAVRSLRSCIHAMREAAEKAGATIEYVWGPGLSRTFP